MGRFHPHIVSRIPAPPCIRAHRRDEPISQHCSRLSVPARRCIGQSASGNLQDRQSALLRASTKPKFNCSGHRATATCPAKQWHRSANERCAHGCVPTAGHSALQIWLHRQAVAKRSGMCSFRQPCNNFAVPSIIRASISSFGWRVCPEPFRLHGG